MRYVPRDASPGNRESGQARQPDPSLGTLEALGAPLLAERSPVPPSPWTSAGTGRNGAARGTGTPRGSRRASAPAHPRAAERPAPRAGDASRQRGQPAAPPPAARSLVTTDAQSFAPQRSQLPARHAAPPSPPSPALTEASRQRCAAKRDALHELRDVAAALSQGAGRVCICGRKVIPGAAGVDVKRAESGRAYFAGVASCGSVWTCACCAAKIARGRQSEVSDLLSRHMAAGGAGLFLTLTVPHDDGAPLPELRRIVARAWRGIQGGAQWIATKERCGIVGTVRALEVTHGRNGWHPHLHVLILCAARLPDEALEALHAGIVARWARAVVRAGLRAPQGERCPLSRIYSYDAADYLAKISAVLELTRWDAKQGRESGRSPFQILAAAGAGSARDVALWREWCDGIRGARQLTWSTGLRERYRLGEAASDEALAAAEVGGDVVVILSRPAWRAICRVPMLRADVLRAAERGGAADVLELLESLPGWPADALVTVAARAGPLADAA